MKTSKGHPVWGNAWDHTQKHKAAAASHMNKPLWFCASLLLVRLQISWALRCSEMMAQSGWIASAWKTWDIFVTCNTEQKHALCCMVVWCSDAWLGAAMGWGEKKHGVSDQISTGAPLYTRFLFCSSSCWHVCHNIQNILLTFCKITPNLRENKETSEPVTLFYIFQTLGFQLIFLFDWHQMDDDDRCAPWLSLISKKWINDTWRVRQRATPKCRTPKL